MFARDCHFSLSWATLIQSMSPHPTSWRPFLILSSHLCLGLPSGLFPTKTLYKPLLSKGNIWYIFLVTPNLCPKILHEFQRNLALIIAKKRVCGSPLFSVCQSNTTVLTANASWTAAIFWVVRTHSVVFDMQYLWAIPGYTNDDINDCNVVITLAELDFCLQRTACPLHASQFAVLLLRNLTTFKLVGVLVQSV